jgi:hypothetical protein
MDTGCASLAPARATADTMQNRLKPRMPIMKTVNGPEYSRIFTKITYRKNFDYLPEILRDRFLIDFSGVC